MATRIYSAENMYKQGFCFATLCIDGRPAWLARELSDAIGVESLEKKILGEWSEFFIPGYDYELLEPSVYEAARDVLVPAGVYESMEQTYLFVLYESGMVVALAKCRTAKATRLRRLITEEAIPQCNADWMEFPHHEAEEEERLDRIAAEQVTRTRLERKRHEYELNRLLVRIFEDSFERLEGHVSNDLLVGLKFKLLDLLIGDDECTRIHMASRFPLRSAAN